MPDGARKKPMMSSVDRTLALLRHFTVNTPEWGLSALARAAGIDKTTALRSLTALERNGFVEQHPETRKYRLGMAPLQLARLREATFPLQATLQPVVDRLAEASGETAHASVLTGRHLTTVAIAAPNRAARVFVEDTLLLPLHATASGLAVLAAMPQAARAEFLGQGPYRAFTDTSPTTPGQVDALLSSAAPDGLVHAMGTYESDVCSTAIALRGWSGAPVGAIALAAVGGRYDTSLATRIDALVREAGATLSAQMGA